MVSFTRWYSSLDSFVYFWDSSTRSSSVLVSGVFAAAPPSVPQRNAPAASGPNAWVRSGLQVFHAKFGEGTVLSMEGLGEDARAQVKFNRHGVKWLALSVAKLTPV